MEAQKIKKQHRSKTQKLLLITGVIGLFATSTLALAQIVATPNPCIGTCTDVPTASNQTTTANIFLADYSIEITVLEDSVATTELTPVTSIPGSNVYVKIGTTTYPCSSATDSNGTCTVPNVPSGFAGSYEIGIDNWLATPSHDNVPFSLTGLDFDTGPHEVSVTLFRNSACNVDDPPPKICSGDIILTATACDETDPMFPDGRWIFTESDCRDQAAVVCPGGTGVIEGTCVYTTSGVATCEADQDDCDDEFPLCNFSQPYNTEHPQGYYENGDVVTLTGQNFGTEGGEVRIGDVKIFIAPNDPNPDFVWTDTQIKFILPPEARTATIGVRPMGYEYQVGLDAAGNVVYIVDANGFLIPIYCYGGLIKIRDFEDLTIPEEFLEINVSVTGG